MALLREYLMATVGSPQAAALQPRKRRSKMTQPEFYEEQAQPQIIAGSQDQTPQVAFQGGRGQRVPMEQELQEQFERIRQGRVAPELEPIARVTSPNSELVQPSNFQSYYGRLQAIREANQSLEGAASARAAFQRMQTMMAATDTFGVPGVMPVGYKNPSFGRIGSGLPGSFGSAGSGLAGVLGNNAASRDSRNAPHVRSAASELGGRFGISNVGGFATSGHIHNSDHYHGHALDFMTRDGQGLADYTVANANRLNVKYVIWNRQIWQPGRGWTRYTGSSPHTDHVHVSFY